MGHFMLIFYITLSDLGFSRARL